MATDPLRPATTSKRKAPGLRDGRRDEVRKVRERDANRGMHHREGQRQRPARHALDGVVLDDPAHRFEGAANTAGLGLRSPKTGHRGVAIFLKHRLAVGGVGVVIFFVLFCFAGPLIYHTNQTNAQSGLANSLAPPSGNHPLGTDMNGYDELGRVMVGGQNSLIVGFAAAVLGTVIGVGWGAVSGFVGGWVDVVMMRIVDTWMAIPPLLLLIILAVILHPSVPVLILVIGFSSWAVPARLVRSEALTLRMREYVQAVRTMGGSRLRIIVRHIMPNAIGTIVVNTTFRIADAILFLAALGYLGLGVPAPQTDWGSMLSTAITFALNGDWWLIYPPGLAILLVVIAFNFIGDGLRDAFDVRMRGR